MDAEGALKFSPKTAKSLILCSWSRWATFEDTIRATNKSRRRFVPQCIRYGLNIDSRVSGRFGLESRPSEEMIKKTMSYGFPESTAGLMPVAQE